ERVTAAKILTGPKLKFQGNIAQFIQAAENALYASKITSYAQGLGLMKIASTEYGYDLRMDDIAKIWRAGCIIRARLLSDIMTAYQRDPQLVNLMLDENFQSALSSRQADWRMVVQSAIGMGIPVPAMSASLAYYDSYRSEKLPANLTQAQRDYFGAHTYRRIDQEGAFHTHWKQEKKD
ncbi:MAG: NADP-dependent phosphogluconate dehydrogenase, partial [Anaerolineaceae bacterium]